MENIFYDPEANMAFSNSPFFPEETSLKHLENAAVPITVHEGATYYAKFYDAPPPPLFNEQFQARGLHQGVYELNFKNYVGLSRLCGLNIDVQNNKISPMVYEAMLDDIADKYAALVFSHTAPTGQHSAKDGPGKDNDYITALFICRYLLRGDPDIDELSALLHNDPHRSLERQFNRCRLDQCSGTDTILMETLFAAPLSPINSKNHLSTTRLARCINRRSGNHALPTMAVREIKKLTVDTNENRFIKFFLCELLKKTADIKGTMDNYPTGYLNQDLQANLVTLQNKIRHVLSFNMWADVGGMSIFPANSQVLQKKEGYRQFFMLFSLLQLTSRCEFLKPDFNSLIENKDVPTLYEYWCFFQIKSIMDTMLKGGVLTNIINTTPVEHTLSRGLCIQYEKGISLFFNRSYTGSRGITPPWEISDGYTDGESYSHTFRPDIVIERLITTHHEKLIFDAKYKGNRPGFYGEGEDGSIFFWKNEDIDKMHTYREGISSVAGSFILYPGSQSIIYPSRDNLSIAHGVGALALRPDKKEHSDGIDNIRQLISAFIKS